MQTLSTIETLEEARGVAIASRRLEPRLHHVRCFARFFLYCLRWNLRPADSLNKVAYLDGLRGVAALLVFIGHSLAVAYPELGAIPSVPFGFEGEYYFIAFPLVRLLFSGGPFAVCCFFIISGYVISLRSLQKLHRNQHARLAADLGVSFPKRFVRLYIPIIGTTFVYMTCWYIFGETPEQSWPEETLTWMHNFFQQSWFYAIAGFWQDRYNGHLWSIATEVRGSYTVYVALLCAVGFHRRGTSFRICAYLGVLSYLMFLVDGSFMALFLVGMMTCDLRLLSDHGELPNWGLKLQKFTQRDKGWIYWVIATLAIFLAGFPGGENYAFEAYGGIWYTLRRLTPAEALAVWQWWMCWGAMCLMITLSHFSCLRRILETPFCQWLGRISFCLYLVHGPVLYAVGGRVYRTFGLINDGLEPLGFVLLLPEYGPTGCDTRFLLAQCIVVPLTFYLAIVATKLFDEPSVRISRYLCSPEPSCITSC